MMIDLPKDLTKRIEHQFNALDIDAVEVIRIAMDTLNFQEQEDQAVLEGINAFKNKDYQRTFMADALYLLRYDGRSWRTLEKFSFAGSMQHPSTESV